MRHHSGWIVQGALALTLWLSPAALEAQAKPTAEEAAKAEALLKDAVLIGKGDLTAYRKDGAVLISLPVDSLSKPFFWYSELVSAPPGVVSQKLEAGSRLGRFERQGNMIFVRDLTQKQGARAGSEPEPYRAGSATDIKIRPIELAVDTIGAGPLTAAFPILGETADGRLIVDVTRTFSNDVSTASARPYVALSGNVPVGVDPEKSYVGLVRARENNLNIQSHLTFIGSNPADPLAGPQFVSVVVGHSIMFLPERAAPSRDADPRIGYFSTNFSEFEPASGESIAKRTVINRFRLEKANPGAAVSDPVKPIVFYIGRGVPERWRPYLRAGVEQWLPAFEAAGFSNAIKVLDAPSPEEDPNWYAEDISINVIRWVPLEFPNAMGPHVVDPRSGETISSHVLVWPSVMNIFGNYYHAMFATLDPDAKTLPVKPDKLGKLMSYVVAHEIGHALGLRHNHMASTAFSVKQMRDPAFANVFGPNSSIMAYGRFNQAAQPEDGITQFWGVVGAYDYAAIKWGYGDFGSDPVAEKKALEELAASFRKDRKLFWGAAEMPEEVEVQSADPRIQRENTGAERIEATRLGVANILRSLDQLNSAAGRNDQAFLSAHALMLSTQIGLLKSVSTLVGGTMPRYEDGPGPRVTVVPAEEQRRAIAYLLGEGAASLDAYERPDIADRVAVLGAARLVEKQRASLLDDVLDGAKIATLESQAAMNPKSYSALDLGKDVADAIWGDLDQASPGKRSLQRAYLARTQHLIDTWANATAAEAAESAKITASGYGPAFAAAVVETGDDTTYPAWLRGYLPGLKDRVSEAATNAKTEADRLHYADMALKIGKLIARAN